MPPTIVPSHARQVFAAKDIFVVQGANQGDGLTEPDEVCEGNLYYLLRAVAPLRLLLHQPQGDDQTVA